MRKQDETMRQIRAYLPKLKKQFIQTYLVLKKENQELKQENQELKQENSKMRQGMEEITKTIDSNSVFLHKIVDHIAEMKTQIDFMSQNMEKKNTALEKFARKILPTNVQPFVWWQHQNQEKRQCQTTHLSKRSQLVYQSEELKIVAILVM